MENKIQVILLAKEGDKLSSFGISSRNSLALIPSYLCIQTLYEEYEENPLLKAYQDKTLSQEQNYLPFYFHQRLQRKIQCFFAPNHLLPHTRFAMLDLSLPIHLALQDLSVLFVYPSYSLLCFYQNQKMQYCKKLSPTLEDINLCKHQIQALFDYTSEIYFLSYNYSLPQELSAMLTPLDSLLPQSSLGGEFHLQEITLMTQEGILTLAPPPPKAYHLLKFMVLSLLGFVLITFGFCFFTHSPSPIQSDDTRSMQILSALHSLPSNQPLFLLLQDLSEALNHTPIIFIEFLYGDYLRIEFPTQIPPHILSFLSSKGYVGKINNPTTLEIAL